MSKITEMGREAGRLSADGRFEEAESICRGILDLQPHNPAARYALAMLLLSREAWAEGWALYEARAHLPELNIVKPRPSCPEWRGEAVRSLLVWPEQGLGDQIMFARWIPELVRRNISVTLLCAPPLAGLFSGLGVSVIPATGHVSVPVHDAWCLIGSLPHLVGEPPSATYLPSGSGGSGLGVLPRGNPRHPNDARRSMPEPFATELLRMGMNLSPEATGATSLEDTRRILADLDLVATVDTAVAHLAGAMGKPTLLLTHRWPEWRWGRGAGRSTLYPRVEIVRQDRPGDWASVLDQLTVKVPLLVNV